MSKLTLAIAAMTAVLCIGTSPAFAMPADAPGDDSATETQLQDAHIQQQAEEIQQEDEQTSQPVPQAGPEDADTMRATAGASGFTPGNLISDRNFRDGSAMTEAQIQTFLQQVVGSCENSLCLARLKLDTPTRTWSWGSCTSYPGAKGESAARIIFKVQRACGISARVILTTLQKEQSLVSDPAPTEAILRKAMGFGCPDTAACDSTYYGFFNQVFAAARQLTWYGNPEGSFTWLKVGKANQIAYNPNASCGTGSVTIQNAATAALYYYTPYQPNAAALANMYGTGDSCSAYGNRNFWRIYRDWFGDPRIDSTSSTNRLAGADRYATAVAISKASYPKSGVPVVYVASGATFADALSAAPAAAAQGGPLLLTVPGTLSPATSAEIKRLAPARIVVVGATGAVNAKVETALKALAPTTRIGGVDRYETSRKIAAAAFPTAAHAYLATGRDYPDALSAAAAAGATSAPVLLVDGTAKSLDSATKAALDRAKIREVRIAGGTGVVSSGIQTALAKSFTTKRYGGADRYLTSVLLNQQAFPSSERAFLASGALFPDALTGAAAAGAAKAPLYLSRLECLPVPVRDSLDRVGASSLTLLGGTGALSNRVATRTVC